ncbi:MAG: CHASE4 domain-containing protein [Opitutaceae bacterium]|nr:CHASE4 domain-containing protein [Opitutaceae bacterium]
MSIKLRFALMLGLLLLAFLVSLLVLRRLESQQSERVLADTRQDRIGLLERWIDLTGVSLRQFTNDYSQWDEMVNFLTRPDAAWAGVNIDASLTNLNAHAVWVLAPDGRVVHAVNRLSDPGLAQPPVPSAELLALAADTPFMHFFTACAEGVIEVRGAPIQPSADTTRTTPARGWFIAARLWDDVQINLLAQLTESKVTLSTSARPTPAEPEDGSIHLLRPLADWRGRTVGMLYLDYRNPELEQVFKADTFEARVFVCFGLLVIFSLGLSLQRWVLGPLDQISASLAQGDTAPIQLLLKERDRTELGRVAQLIESAFSQKTDLLHEVEERKRAEAALRQSEAALRRTLEEQARLGRDMHDGVIQSLYAAGLGLAVIREQLRRDPAEAETRLDQTRMVLNETIRDLRNFITGLEPEALKTQTFAHAAERLIGFMQAVHPVRATIAIDEPTAANLTLEQRAHALQIAREAVSNALRHGKAAHVHLALQRRDGRAEFIIEDDGEGFDPEARKDGGRGLNNLAERARELGAELRVASAPGKGTRVAVVFPLPIVA